jgi:hypothetical protein
MLEHYSHIRQQAKRKAVKSLDNATITSQLARLSQLRTFFGFFAMSFIVKPCVFIVGL